jgi:regulatory subunit for Cdc7p protein kinase
MKIWTVEKLQRIINALTHEQEPHTKASREAELVQLLKNERKQTATDRDWMSEMVNFRGCFIYVRDMDERTKPTMIRDYPKADRKDLGKWPQLRVAGPGRCPFVEDNSSKRSATVAAGRVTEKVRPRTRAATTDSRRLRENPNPPAQAPPKQHKPLDPPGEIPQKRGSTDQLPAFYGSAQAAIRPAARLIRGEPVASGLQQSNITSAVRSQMVSSTAAQPGGKAGTSRGLNMLKRKVLGAEKPLPLRPDEEELSKKRKMLEELTEEQEEEEGKAVSRKKRVVEKECKPGYCENCREKFEDFDDVSFDHYALRLQY